MYECLTMIITNTVKIFKTRQRRLRKNKAADGSSDQQSYPHNDGDQSVQNQDFLVSISSCSSSDVSKLFKSVEENNISLQSETHDIYEDQTEVLEVSTAKNILEINQSSIMKLVCDFKDIDVQKTISDYKRISENTHFQRGQEQNYLTLTSIASKKPTFQSIIISDNKNSEHKSMIKDNNQQFNEQKGIKRSMNKYYRQPNTYYQDRLESERMSSRDRLQIGIRRVRQEPRIQEIADKQRRRQKIRDKAAELLIRVKSQNYLSSRNDFIEY